MIRRAFVRSLEIIGETAKRVPTSFRESHLAIDWMSIGGMSDRLNHGYFGVDYDIVWDVAAQKIPALRAELIRLLDAP